MAAAAAQSPAAPQQPGYAPAVRAADAQYRGARLALTPDGRWLAIAARAGVTVVPSQGGRHVRVPLPAAASSCVPAWDGAGSTLAMVCSVGPATKAVFTWRRGAPTARVIEQFRARLGHPTSVQWLDGGRLAYVTERQPTPRPVMPSPDAPEAAPAVPPPSARPAEPPPCIPAVSQGRSVAVLCSDSVDVLRSRALESRLSVPAGSRQGTDEPEGRAAADASTFGGATFDLIVADVEERTRTVVASLHGISPALRTTGDHRRIAIFLRDSARSTPRGLDQFHSLYVAGVPLRPDATSDGQVVRALQGVLGWFVTNDFEDVFTPWAWTSDGMTVAWWPRALAHTADADTLYLASVTDDHSPVAVALPRQEGAARGDGQVAAPRLTNRWSTMLSWTPDGSRVVVVVHGGLWLVPRRGAAPEFLPAERARVVQQVVSVSNRDALVATIDRPTGRSGLFSVDLASRRWRRVAEYDRSPPTALTASRSGARTVVAYVASTDTSPSNVYTLTLSGAAGARVQSRQLTRVSVDASLPALRDTLLAFPVAPGVTATAVLVGPASASGPLPTIISVYPGESAASLLAHRPKVHNIVDAFAAVERGYAVMWTDVPLPPYGVYGRLGPTAAMVDAMEAAIAAAAQTGWVDTTRLGVIGHSYGGTTVNVLVTHAPERFRAAVSLSGMSDFVSSVYGGSIYGPDWWVTVQGRMGVPFREQPERYLANSPIRHLDRVTTPLLLIHGEQDGIVSVSQSQEMFRGLAQLGKPVEFVRYRDANHGDDKFFEAAWSRALEWFDKFLLSR